MNLNEYEWLTLNELKIYQILNVLSLREIDYNFSFWFYVHAASGSG